MKAVLLILQEYILVFFVAVFKEVIYKIMGVNRDVPGGSTIADQLCNQAQERLPFIFNPEITYDEYRRKHYYLTKGIDTVCGIGMAGAFQPKEISASYMTFVYLGSGAQGFEPFVRIFYGFDGIDDSRMTIGHQAVLSSMVKRPWNSTDGQWDKIKARARYAVDKMIDNGILNYDDLEHLLTEAGLNEDGANKGAQEDIVRSFIYDQINEARPFDRKDVDFSLAPKPGYDYLIYRAIIEARKFFGEDFREEISTIKLTSDGWVQGALIKAIERELKNLEHPDARAFGLLVDDDTGEIIAAFSGKVNDKGKVVYDGVDRLFGSGGRGMGSTGKLLLTVGVGKEGYLKDSEDGRVVDFRYHLRRSRKDIIFDAKRLDVDPEDVRFLIECFGDPHEDMSDPIASAAMGTFTTWPHVYISLMKAVREGDALPEVHVTDKYVMRDGEEIPYSPSIDADLVECAEWVYARDSLNGRDAGPLIWDWFSVPLENGGTLRRLNGIVEAGKTGTDGKVRTQDEPGTTNAAYVVIGTDRGDIVVSGSDIFNAPPMSGAFGILADRRDIDLGNSLAGGTLPALIAKDTVLKAKERFRVKNEEL